MPPTGILPPSGTRATTTSSAVSRRHSGPQITPELRQAIFDKLDAKGLCDALGIHGVSDAGGGQVRGPCPIHHGKNPSAFSVECGPGMPAIWMCRTDCSTCGDAFDLVERVNRCSFGEALVWLMAHVGIEDRGQFRKADAGISADRKDVYEFNREMEHIKAERKRSSGKFRSPCISEEFVAKCMRRRNGYFRNRGYDEETLTLFEVGFCPAYDSPWANNRYPARVVIPLRNAQGALKGISGRVMVDGVDVDDKYKILPGSDKYSYFYGSSRTMPFVTNASEAILVEGFPDLWRCWQMGFRNVLGLMGKDLTRGQLRILLGVAHRVYVAVDNDEAGKKGGDVIQETLKRYLTVYRVNCPEGCDPGDCNKEQLEAAMRSARRVH